MFAVAQKSVWRDSGEFPTDFKSKQGAKHHLALLFYL